MVTTRNSARQGVTSAGHKARPPATNPEAKRTLQETAKEAYEQAGSPRVPITYCLAVGCAQWIFPRPTALTRSTLEGLIYDHAKDVRGGWGILHGCSLVCTCLVWCMEAFAKMCVEDPWLALRIALRGALRLAIFGTLLSLLLSPLYLCVHSLYVYGEVQAARPDTEHFYLLCRQISEVNTAQNKRVLRHGEARFDPATCDPAKHLLDHSDLSYTAILVQQDVAAWLRALWDFVLGIPGMVLEGLVHVLVGVFTIVLGAIFKDRKWFSGVLLALSLLPLCFSGWDSVLPVLPASTTVALTNLAGVAMRAVQAQVKQKSAIANA